MNRSIQESAFVLRAFTVGLAIAMQAVPGVPGATAGEAQDRGARGKIVIYAQFVAGDRPGGQEWGLHVVDPETNTWTRIAEYPIKNGVVAMATFRVSPDATRLAYNEYRDHRTFVSPGSVWLRDIRPAVEPRKISDIGGRPIWSSDGKHLLLVEVIGGGPDKPDEPVRYATWKMDDDGSHAVRLPIPVTDQVADWSSDGQWLVGVGSTETVLMHPDGTGRHRLPGPGVGWQARFSPDGKRIAYVAAAKDPNRMQGKSIWVVGIDGKDRRAIYLEPETAYLDQVVNWSPDGKELVTILQTWTRINNDIVTPKNPRLCVLNVESRRMRIVSHRPAVLLGQPEWR